MLSVNNYELEYVDDCRSKIAAQVSAFRKMIASASKQVGGNAKALDPAIASFEPVFINNMVLVLDSYFMHRSRGIESKNGNPLNEDWILRNSMRENNNIVGADKTIKYDPAKVVLKHEVGDEIRLSESDFSLLAEAYFADVESKFLWTETRPLE